MKIKKIFGVTIERIKEVIDLFKEGGYDLKDDEQFKWIKRDYFHKVEKEIFHKVEKEMKNTMSRDEEEAREEERINAEEHGEIGNN